MRKVSRRKATELRQEKQVMGTLMEIYQGHCAICGKLPGWLGLSKHEIKTRAEGGDVLDIYNCVPACQTCHDIETAHKRTLMTLDKIREHRERVNQYLGIDK